MTDADWFISHYVTTSA